MYQDERPIFVLAARDNIPWVVERTGRPADEIETLLVMAEEADVVCTVEVKES